MRFVGTSVKRVDGVKKVTGSLKYVDDMKLPRMLYASVVRSPYAHARIVSIDITAAQALKGVRDIIDGSTYTKRGASIWRTRTSWRWARSAIGAKRWWPFLRRPRTSPKRRPDW